MSLVADSVALLVLFEQRKGFDVTLFEKNNQLGGRSRSFNKMDFS